MIFLVMTVFKFLQKKKIFKIYIYMRIKNVRRLKNNVLGGYVLQKDGTWKWRFISKNQLGGNPQIIQLMVKENAEEYIKVLEGANNKKRYKKFINQLKQNIEKEDNNQTRRNMSNIKKLIDRDNIIRELINELMRKRVENNSWRSVFNQKYMTYIRRLEKIIGDPNVDPSSLYEEILLHVQKQYNKKCSSNKRKKVCSAYERLVKILSETNKENNSNVLRVYKQKKKKNKNQLMENLKGYVKNAQNNKKSRQKKLNNYYNKKQVFNITNDMNREEKLAEELERKLQELINKLKVQFSTQGPNKINYRNKLAKKLEAILQQLKSKKFSMIKIKEELALHLTQYLAHREKKWKNREEITSLIDKILRFIKNINASDLVRLNNSNHGRTGNMSDEERLEMEEIERKERIMNDLLGRIINNLDILEMKVELMGNELNKNKNLLSNTIAKTEKVSNRVKKGTADIQEIHSLMNKMNKNDSIYKMFKDMLKIEEQLGIKI